jgi:hypothetical protein
MSRSKFIPVFALTALAFVNVVDRAAAKQFNNPRSSRLEGAWTFVPTVPGLPAAFPDTFNGLVTFLPGGNVVENSWAPDLPTNSGAGQGVWTRIRDHEFSFTIPFLWFDQGRLFVLGKARATVTVDGDQANGQVTFETVDSLDASATVLASGTGTLRATRVHAD